MSELLSMARTFRSGGFTRAEADALAAKATRGGVSREERTELRAIAELYRDEFRPGAINPVRDLAEAISVSVETGTRVDVSVPGIADVQVDTRTRVDVVVPLFGKLKNAVRSWWARGRAANG